MGYVSRLRLKNFRNYEECDINLREGITLLLGDNGHGKTNLLEALYYLSLLRSFRTAKTKNMAFKESGFFFLEGEAVFPEQPLKTTHVSVSFGDQRVLKKNSKKIAKASEFINTFQCVAFVPEDIRLVSGGPAYRRRFLDILISRLDHDYLSSLIQFNTVLKERNALLKDGPGKYDNRLIGVYEDYLAYYGAKLIQRRNDIVKQIQRIVTNYTASLPALHCLAIAYKPSSTVKCDDSREQSLYEGMKKKLYDNRERDAYRGFTQTGPHRDDLWLGLGEHSCAAYASQGESRMVSLVLRLTACDLLSNLGSDNTPIVLLIDDIFGELDDNARNVTLGWINKSKQTIIASTHIPPGLNADKADIYNVKNGSLTPG